MLDFGFWVNFRQEDRICRKEGEEKAETGDWRPERKGRATGEGRGDFGFWMNFRQDLQNEQDLQEGGLWRSRCGGPPTRFAAPA